MTLAKTIIFSVLISANMVIWYEAVGVEAAYVGAGVVLLYALVRR